MARMRLQRRRRNAPGWAPAGHRDRPPGQGLFGVQVGPAQPLGRARAGRGGRPRAAAAEVEAGGIGIVAPGSAAAIGAVRLGRLGVGHDALMVPAVPDSSRRPGALVVCPTPIGNLSDVTLRLLEELRSADVVACEDTRRTRILLDRHGIAVPLLAVHEHNEAVRAPEVVERIRRGERVALATDAGMPAVSDPGARIVAAVAAAGLEVTVLPGPSAVTAAVAASGLGGAGFVFAGFLPRPAAAPPPRCAGSTPAAYPWSPSSRRGGCPRRWPRWPPPSPTARPPCAASSRRCTSRSQRGTLADLAERFATAPKGEVTLVLAGVPARAGGEQDVPADALAELVAAFGSRRAAALASRLTGVPRNRLYQTATKP